MDRRKPTWLIDLGHSVHQLIASEQGVPAESRKPKQSQVIVFPDDRGRLLPRLRRFREVISQWFVESEAYHSGSPGTMPSFPFKAGRITTLAEEYAVLGAIHDHVYVEHEKIGPFGGFEGKAHWERLDPDHHHTRVSIWAAFVTIWVSRLYDAGPQTRAALQGYFEDVRRDLEAIAPPASDKPTDAESQQVAPGESQTSLSNTAKLEGEAKALALLVQHPDWTNTQIARAVPCARQTLYKWSNYTAARGALQDGKKDMPRGSKTRDHDVEAWDEESEQ